MKLKLQHIDFISRIITKDLVNNPMIEVRKDKEQIEAIMNNAPKSEDGYFVVPAIIE